MSWAHVDELDRIEMPDGFVWRPVRRHFGIRAFGVNAYTALEAGSPIVETHTESQLGHEEIYFVLRGRALFTVDGNEHELGAGRARLRERPVPEAGRGRRRRGHRRARARRQAGRAARGLGVGGDVRRRPGREPRGLGRGDPDPRGGARRAARPAGAPLQPRVHGGPRRPPCRRAAAPAAGGRRSSRSGPTTRAATPTSRRSAASPASPPSGRREPATSRRLVLPVLARAGSSATAAIRPATRVPASSKPPRSGGRPGRSRATSRSATSRGSFSTMREHVHGHRPEPDHEARLVQPEQEAALSERDDGDPGREERDRRGDDERCDQRLAAGAPAGRGARTRSARR